MVQMLREGLLEVSGSGDDKPHLLDTARNGAGEMPTCRKMRSTGIDDPQAVEQDQHQPESWRGSVNLPRTAMFLTR
jgi:hypothetical protein